MTRNQAMTLKPGDMVRVIRATSYKFGALTKVIHPIKRVRYTRHSEWFVQTDTGDWYPESVGYVNDIESSTNA